MHWPFCTRLYKYKFIYLLLILHIKTKSHHLEPINLMEICQTVTLEENSGHHLKKHVSLIDFYFKIGELLIKMLFHNLSSLQITNGQLWEVCLTWQIADLSFCWLLIWLHGTFPFPFPLWSVGGIVVPLPVGATNMTLPVVPQKTTRGLKNHGNEGLGQSSTPPVLGIDLQDLTPFSSLCDCHWEEASRRCLVSTGDLCKEKVERKLKWWQCHLTLKLRAFTAILTKMQIKW